MVFTILTKIQYSSFRNCQYLNKFSEPETNRNQGRLFLGTIFTIQTVKFLQI